MDNPKDSDNQAVIYPEICWLPVYYHGPPPSPFFYPEIPDYL